MGASPVAAHGLSGGVRGHVSSAPAFRAMQILRPVQREDSSENGRMPWCRDSRGSLGSHPAGVLREADADTMRGKAILSAVPRANLRDRTWRCPAWRGTTAALCSSIPDRRGSGQRPVRGHRCAVNRRQQHEPLGGELQGRDVQRTMAMWGQGPLRRSETPGAHPSPLKGGRAPSKECVVPAGGFAFAVGEAPGRRSRPAATRATSSFSPYVPYPRAPARSGAMTGLLERLRSALSERYAVARELGRALTASCC